MFFISFPTKAWSTRAPFDYAISDRGREESQEMRIVYEL
jgi:hypothetical protein